MELKRNLKLIDVFAIASGAMVSSGLFILPGIAHAKAGPGVIVSYLLAALLAMTGMLCVAELATAMPRAAGDYFFITRSMGSAVGTVAGLLTWLALALKTAFALIGMAAFTMHIIPLNINFLAAIFCIVFLLINIVGVKEASSLQVALVAGLLILLGIYTFTGFAKMNVNYLEPFAPNGLSAIFATCGFVFVSYGGLIKVASIAEEVDNPQRNIPLGMILSLLVVGLMYTFVIMVTSGILGAEQLDNSLTPISDGAMASLGPWGKRALDIAAILAFVSTANAGIMSASRYPFALSRDNLLPEIFSRVNARFKTPHVSIIVTVGFIIVFLFFKLEVLVEAASTVLILTYMLSILSVIILRESGIQNYQPIFKAPLYPGLQIIGFLGFGFLIFEMGIEAIMISLLLIVGGLFMYWFYGRIRSTREYALLHLIERISDKKLTSQILESELREIIIERDEITADRFDMMIGNALVIDLDQACSREELFQIIASKISEKVKIDKDKLYQAFETREEDSSTVITPYLAIPHVVIPGNKIFEVILVRSNEGIAFSKDSPNVHAVFFLIGSSDERNFHLKALSAIAQIVQHPKFEKRWIKARNIENLRDLILLGKRRRFQSNNTTDD